MINLVFAIINHNFKPKIHKGIIPLSFLISTTIYSYNLFLAKGRRSKSDEYLRGL